MTVPSLTFIIPVRHPHNARDWGKLRMELACTIKSIAAQDSDDWQAVIVANMGSDLPEIPEGFKVKYVDFPMNDKCDIKAFDPETFYAAFRFDKGRRVLAGMLDAGETDYFMVVDHDDFVNCHIGSFVSKNKKEGICGWKIFNGYVWGENSRLLYDYTDFSMFCGTSLIIRREAYALPASVEGADPEYIRSMLGSHVLIQEILKKKGSPLEHLPFKGGVYRIGHAGAVSQSPGLFRQFLFNKACLRNPFRFLYRCTKFRLLTPSLYREFWGAG